MAKGHSDKFRRDAVRIALTSGLTRPQISSHWGVVLLTLNRWIKSFDEEAIVSGLDQELAQENERLRRESRVLKEKRDVLKKLQPSSRGKRREVRIYRPIRWHA